MARIHHSLPPKGTRIGIAFSGGLDTRTAVAWMSRQGLEVYAYTADLAQPDEKNVEDIPPIATDHGARIARLLDCRDAMVREGVTAIQCGAFHLATGGKRYFNTTPLGRAVTTTAIIRAMRGDGVHVFSDGSTHKGNDIQRFFRYGVLVNPALTIYKPWLDRAFVEAFGGRKEMSLYLDSIGKPYILKTRPGSGEAGDLPSAIEKAYSTDANVLGATHEAKDLESLGTSMRIVAPIMGVAHWKSDVPVEHEDVTVELVKGVPVTVNGVKRASLFETFAELNAIGGRHGLGMSDQIENRVIDAKSRGIYEAPGMALLHVVYERLLSAVHNENTTDLYASLGRKLGRLLYEGRWFDPEALMLKEAMTRWVAPAVTGTVTLELRRGDDYTILDTRAVRSAYDPHKLSMEKTESAFSPEDRIGALEMQSLGVMDNRELLLHFAKALGTGAVGAHNPLLGDGTE
jgi:argininosuccinate synthase